MKQLSTKLTVANGEEHYSNIFINVANKSWNVACNSIDRLVAEILNMTKKSDINPKVICVASLVYWLD